MKIQYSYFNTSLSESNSLAEYATLIAVSVLSPVNTHTTIPEKIKFIKFFSN